MPRMLFQMRYCMRMMWMQAGEIEEEDAADDEGSSDAMGNMQGLAKVDMRQEKSEHSTDGECEINDREWKALNSLIEAKDREKA